MIGLIFDLYVTTSQKRCRLYGKLLLSNPGGCIMERTIRRKRKAVVDTDMCVACGCCVKVCPMEAIEIWRGIAARVAEEKCVGCGKCARECPASVIEIREEGERR